MALSANWIQFCSFTTDFADVGKHKTRMTKMSTVVDIQIQQHVLLLGRIQSGPTGDQPYCETFPKVSVL